ncbi:MAG TPA: MASE1 domain-containing protein [Steroidobacteraceae bacterium]|nr:MASE1 domain-containing protein [Steroidobacteraceae bacterium]
MKVPTAKDWLTLAALVLVYIVTAKLGLAFAVVNLSATAFWPPAGIALAAVLVLGTRAWPAIFLGAFVANVTTQGGALTSLGIATGNTLEALAGAYLVNRFASGRLFYERPKDLFAFAGLAAILSTTVSAAIGLSSLMLAGLASASEISTVGLTWWLGDAAGDLMVAPLLVMWATAPPLRSPMDWMIEGSALLAGLTLVSLIVFAGAIPAVALEHYPLEFLCMPFLFWAAFRLGRRAVATCVLVVSMIAIAGTVDGLGPFARSSRNESLLLLQSYLAVGAITMLAVAAVVRQRERSELALQREAARDSLTGLPNYRHFIGALDQEIRRSLRTGRPFAVLMLDLNRLKDVNDNFGHLTGNRALCRVAEAVNAVCRAVDVPARFGGDEFAVILPETSGPGAQKVARRIAERLAADAESPPVSVSIGVAVFPRDGTAVEPLLNKADRDLYDAKRSPQPRQP